MDLHGGGCGWIEVLREHSHAGTEETEESTNYIDTMKEVLLVLNKVCHHIWRSILLLAWSWKRWMYLILYQLFQEYSETAKNNGRSKQYDIKRMRIANIAQWLIPL